jgi:uncharacterized peroxidase-related enzyme
VILWERDVFVGRSWNALEDKMTFITVTPEGEAEGATKALYDGAKARFGFLPNMAKAFSHRPEVWQAWGVLLGSISSRMEPRRYELVTLAAAQELRSSYCMLAHGSILVRDFFSADELKAIVNKTATAKLHEADREVMQFAQKVVRDASSVTEADIENLRKVGLSDEEIFDIAGAAAARCFFSKILDALGAHPDYTYNELDEDLKRTLTVGRPIE